MQRTRWTEIIRQLSQDMASRWRTPRIVGIHRFRREGSDTCSMTNIALEKHEFTVTRVERILNSKHWVFSIFAQGSQLTRQRPDYAAAKRECQQQQDEYMAETKQLYKPIHPSKQMRQNPNQQFEGSEVNDCVVDRKTGWNWFQVQQGNLPHTPSSSSSSWQNSSWQNWNSWWCPFPKPDERHWVFFFLKHAVSGCWNVVPTFRRYSGSMPWRLKSHWIIFVCLKERHLSTMSSPYWSLSHLLSSSPPQHEAPPGNHDLLQDDFFTEHLFQNFISRQAALKNRSRSSITRVVETCATLVEQVVSPKSFRQFLAVL